MRTFWTYFIIFSIIVAAIQAFGYFSADVHEEFDFLTFFKQIIIVFLIATITSFLDRRKKKKVYNEKAS